MNHGDSRRTRGTSSTAASETWAVLMARKDWLVFADTASNWSSAPISISLIKSPGFRIESSDKINMIPISELSGFASESSYPLMSFNAHVLEVTIIRFNRIVFHWDHEKFISHPCITFIENIAWLLHWYYLNNLHINLIILPWNPGKWNSVFPLQCVPWMDCIHYIHGTHT